MLSAQNISGIEFVQQDGWDGWSASERYPVALADIRLMCHVRFTIDYWCRGLAAAGKT